MISLYLKKNNVQMGMYRLTHLHTVESQNFIVVETYSRSLLTRMTCYN